MSTHPYIPLYVDDYEAATTHLSVEEDGVYSRLIRLCWRTPGCSLPDDHAWIARKIRLSAEDFERIAGPVLAEFFTVQRGRLVQRRLKREYDDISRKKSARKSAGKKGGEAKARKTQDLSASNATVLLPHTRAFPEPYPEPDKDTEAKASARASLDQPDAAAWATVKILLNEREQIGPDQAGKFFGQLLARSGLEARDMLPALASCGLNGSQRPRDYLTKAAAAIAKRRTDQQPKRVGFV